MFYRSEGRGLSRKHIIESVQASLDRLQLSYIDVVMIHKVDPMCPMEGNPLLFSFLSSYFKNVVIKLSCNVFRGRPSNELCDQQRLGYVLGHVQVVPCGNNGSIHELQAIQLRDTNRRASRVSFVLPG